MVDRSGAYAPDVVDAMGFAYLLPGRLAQGSKPEPYTDLSDRFDTIVFTADEYQPLASWFPGVRVLHVPLDDDPRGVTVADLDRAERASLEIVSRLRHGQRVLVTCWQGRNRSGLVSALTLIRLGTSPKIAIARIRYARLNALSNPHFVDYLLHRR
jgi:hypothetical protein